MFIAMTGATIMETANGSGIVAKFKGSKAANCVRVTLDGGDTYSVEFLKIRGTEIKEVSNTDGVYCDMLRPIFERTTGLRTSL